MRTLFLLVLAVLATYAQDPRNLPARPLNKNDLIAISVYDEPELGRIVRIGMDGNISLRMLPLPIRAEGRMPTELEAAIAKALVAEKILVDPYVTVIVAEYNSRPIQVIGAVKKPSTFQAIGPVTLLEVLASAEGLTDTAGSEILVSGTLTRRIRVAALMDAADPEANITLTGGEEVRVPEAGRITVFGKVRKPGAYPLKSGAESSVLQALAFSEGLLPYSNKQAFLYRSEGNGSKNEIPIALDAILKRKSPDIPLQANDLLYVPDNRSGRLGANALEKILSIGTGAAVIGLGYGLMMH